MNNTEDNKDLPAMDPKALVPQDLPGYPIYPASEDIYEKMHEEENIDPENISKLKEPNDPNGEKNEKDFSDNPSGSDLDVPVAEEDELNKTAGNEDEENSFYSLGGDDHHDLEENTGTGNAQY